MIEFRLLYKTRYSNGCSHIEIDTLWLFISSVIAFTFYRIISSIVFYGITNNWKTISYQILDLELCHTIYIGKYIKKQIHTNTKIRAR